MYTTRIQLTNYGPIEKLDIEFPFEGDIPKPIVLVGENGSGKSILLSHIVNCLIAAKAVVYPDTPEVEPGKVYKLRSSSYIKSESEYYFAKVDFEEGLFVTEIRLQRLKREYETTPAGVSEPSIQAAWNKMNPEQNDHFDSSSVSNNQSRIEDIFSKRCVLYFPPNRFEEPAWLNEENLKARAQYLDMKHMKGQTERKVINYSPLHDNQNWLFEVVYDRAAFEMQARNFPINLPIENATHSVPLPLFLGYSGDATNTYEAALRIVRAVTRREDARFGIGRRNNRVVSLMSDLTGQILPNIFQLSSGETSLLNLFLSILRDFDLCGTPFSQAADIRGIVVVDEIDLHLHTVHQHEVLPELIQMFPNVQFVVTTHSPLFVLGMQRVLGEDGFAIYQLPEGKQISPEEFSEFGEAYRSFANSHRFAKDIEEALEKEKKPVLMPEGETDIRYLEKAAQLLGEQETLDVFQSRDGGGAGKLTNIFRDFHAPLTELFQHLVVLLFDCDKNKPARDKGRLYQRSIPLQPGNPMKTGIENLFTKITLERAMLADDTLINIEYQHEAKVGGHTETVQERWTVNDSQKRRLCDWLCESGNADDFQAFKEVFYILAEVLKVDSNQWQEESVTVVSGEVSDTDEESPADATQ